MSNISLCKSRQVAFAQEWFRFLRMCRDNKIKMNQSIAAACLGIKRSTFSHSINHGPSDAVLLRFCRFTGIKPEQIDTDLNVILPFNETFHEETHKTVINF